MLLIYILLFIIIILYFSIKKENYDNIIITNLDDNIFININYKDNLIIYKIKN